MLSLSSCGIVTRARAAHDGVTDSWPSGLGKARAKRTPQAGSQGQHRRTTASREGAPNRKKLSTQPTPLCAVLAAHSDQEGIEGTAKCSKLW